MQQKHVLVVGGGISGITTALEIAEVGHNVTLIEKKPYLGGKVVQFSKYFPKLCPPQCGLEINFQRIRKNPRVEILTSSGVDSIDGTHGNFKVKIKRKAQLINSNCTACGKCADVCPVERENEFNYSLDKTKAAYLPHEMAFPFKYTIDDARSVKKTNVKSV
jgi:quinone-modifying oxidoreductase subunit QmoA